MLLAMVPPSSDGRPSSASSLRRFGAMAPMPASMIATEPKLANPHSAKVTMPKVFSDRPCAAPR